MTPVRLKKNDEYYTPKTLVEPIVPFVKGRFPWLPFDTPNSEFFKTFCDNGISCTWSHIAYGVDFFKTTRPQWAINDCIISNIPFSRKLDFFKKCFNEIGKPFAVLLRLGCLDYQEIGEFFYKSGKQLQLWIPDKKVSFDGNTSSFNTAYFGWNFFEKDLSFFHLENNNSNKNYIKPSMETDREYIKSRLGL